MKTRINTWTLFNNTNQMNKKFMFHIDTSKGPKYNLTNQGFHFVLLDTPSQVHLILLKFIEHI